MKNKKNKGFKKIIGIFLPVMLICFLIPQTVHAADFSAVSGEDCTITISVDYGSHSGYLFTCYTPENYSLMSATLAANVGKSYNIVSNAATYAGYKASLQTDTTATIGPYNRGDVAHVVVYIVDDDGTDLTLVSLHTEAVTIGGAPQTATAANDNHTHSYEWITITEPSLTRDGVEQYVCACGDVQITQPVPAATVYIKGFYGAVKNASQDGTANVNCGKWTGISDYVIRKLVDRPDVTTKITFEYKNASYTFTIPAGTSFESLLNDNENYYGFFTFCELLGIPVTQL